MAKRKSNSDTIQETRSAKVLMGSPGGNASKGACYYRVSIPPKWAQAIGIAADDRNVCLSFDGECITIKKVDA